MFVPKTESLSIGLDKIDDWALFKFIFKVHIPRLSLIPWLDFSNIFQLVLYFYHKRNRWLILNAHQTSPYKIIKNFDKYFIFYICISSKFVFQFFNS